MFPTFTSTLEDCNVSLEDGNFHLITETPYISANAITVYYLLKSLKDKSVCFIALQNTWSHYCNIASKFGINLKNKTEDGIVTVLDSFKSLFQLLNGAKDQHCFNFLNQYSDRSLKDMYLYIANAVEQFRKAERPVVLIIDSLNPLIHLGVKPQEIDNFIHYAKNLVSEPRDLIVASCSIDDIDATSKCLATHLYHKCSALLEVKGLQTGKSKNIHGEINIVTCSKDYNYKGSRNAKTFHFKVIERDIKVFSPGLASQTL